MGEAPQAGGHGNKERDFPETLDEGGPPEFFSSFVLESASSLACSFRLDLVQ
jgi:hypothetical protein